MATMTAFTGEADRPAPRRLHVRSLEPAGSVVVVLLTVILILPGAHTARSQTISDLDLWAGLEPGPHTVGFRVVQTSDPDRPFGDKGAARPLQILVWYPASTGDPATRLDYEDYFRLAATEIDPTEPDESRAVAHLIEVRRMAIEEGASEKRFNSLLALPALAHADAEPAVGRFPIVVFSPGMGSSAFQNTVLCEYLASQGFVVAASPSVGPDGREMPEGVSGIEAQIADIQLAIDTVGGLAIADPAKVGLVGFSWGGMAVLIHAMENRRVSAVAALDPTLAVRQGHELARHVPGYRPTELRAPTLLMLAAARQWKERDTSFFDEITNSRNAMLMRFKDFRHGDFASTIILFFIASKADHGGRDLDRIRLGYTAMCRYLAAFFGANLGSDPAARRLLDEDPAKLGIPDGVVEVERRAAPRAGPEAPTRR